MKNKIVECRRCVFTSADANEIYFDSNGICNFCNDYDLEVERSGFRNLGNQFEFDKIITKLKKDGRGKKYDTILGVSGGVDSSYLALKLKEQNVRVLLYHYDNGWNSELAVKNIESMSEALGFDLHTIVVDWNEFRDIQMSYLKAGVIDIEAITDHSAIFATKLVAKKFGIKNIVGGHNFVTESILPKSWIYPNKGDWYNLRDIHKKHGKLPIKTVPVNSLINELYFKFFHKIEWHYPLNYVQYLKDDVKAELVQKLNWRDYGGKHYESVWTRFYQGYFLPTRYGIDKRKAHLSNLICSGQLSRDAALLCLDEPIYDSKLLSRDFDFVLKKFGLTKDEFNRILNLPKASHYDFDHLLPIAERYPFLSLFVYLKRMLKNEN